MFSSPSTGWDWKEGWKRKEKRAWTQLPASGQPSQSHACSAQSSHYDRELSIPAFQTSKCHLPSPCAWQSVPSAGLVRKDPEALWVRENATHNWCITVMCYRDLQLHCCHICFLMPALRMFTCISSWEKARAAANLFTLLMLLYLSLFFYICQTLQRGNRSDILCVLMTLLRT